MAKKTPVKYVADDGLEFDTEAAADRHNEFVRAKRKYDDARQRYARLLFETQKTADGEPFEFSLLRDYWYIAESWDGLPHLRKVSFYVWHCTLNDNDETEILQLREPAGNGYTHYRISELYRWERNAKKELLKRQKARLKELEAEVALRGPRASSSGR